MRAALNLNHQLTADRVQRLSGALRYAKRSSKITLCLSSGSCWDRVSAQCKGYWRNAPRLAVTKCA
jgi:uncharacterized membrane protein